MDIRIKIHTERDFLDAIYEIEKYTEEIKPKCFPYGRVYVTYIIDDARYEQLDRFDKIKIESFRC